MYFFTFDKNIQIMKRLFIVAAIVIFASCSSDDDSGDVNTSEFEQVKTTLPQGKWKVSTFNDNGIDKSEEFESFKFTFNKDGSVEAQNDLLTELGTWNYDNTSSSSEKLNLKFGEINPFDEISDDWNIISVTNSKVELSDDDGNGDIELLTFIKL